ncbi:exocyst complex component 1-related [Anaeramoeba ignava]|uniref:Exocyst complex component 1-related n=1 Tax=Anaeramoeba ignava TaxID=1746090 RepID=A0A9Q0LG93_ANAIG|nr:exocyst complex component 1-related [Anaeramoeba ignava]
MFKPTLNENNPNEFIDSRSLSTHDIKNIDSLLGKTKSFDQADDIVKQLNKQLHNLEKTNIIELIKTEEATREIVERLEEAQKELSEMQNLLNLFSGKLNSMRRNIQQIEKDNNERATRTTNRGKVLEDISSLITRFNDTEQDCKIIENQNLDTTKPLELSRIWLSIQKLSLSIKKEESLGLLKLNAVHTKISRFNELETIFKGNLVEFLIKRFENIDQLSRPKNNEQNSVNVSKTKKIEFVHKQLVLYSCFIAWLKDLDQPKYLEVQTKYIHEMRNLYRKQFHKLFEELKNKIFKEERKANILQLPPTIPHEKKLPPNKEKITTIFEKALNEIAPFIFLEQKFVHIFFNFCDTKWQEFNGNFKEIEEMESLQVPNSEKISQLLEQIFEGTILPQLEILIEKANKMDNLFILQMIGTVHRFIVIYRDHDLVLLRLLTECQIELQKVFSVYIDSQIRIFEESKIPGKRCGIFPIFIKFPLFVERIEKIIDSDSRGSADHGYLKIVVRMFEWLEKEVAESNQKYRNIYLFENYHHFFSSLEKSFQIPSLDPYIAQAKEKYEKNFRSYINSLIRTNFSEPADFFMKIDSLLPSHTYQEVTFQSSFSMGAFTQMIKKFSNKSIEDRISLSFKKINKDIHPSYGLREIAKSKLKIMLLEIFQHWENIAFACYETQMVPSFEIFKEILDQMIK